MPISFNFWWRVETATGRPERRRPSSLAGVSVAEGSEAGETALKGVAVDMDGCVVPMVKVLLHEGATEGGLMLMSGELAGEPGGEEKSAGCNRKPAGSVGTGI